VISALIQEPWSSTTAARSRSTRRTAADGGGRRRTAADGGGRRRRVSRDAVCRLGALIELDHGPIHCRLKGNGTRDGGRSVGMRGGIQSDLRSTTGDDNAQL